MSRGATANDYTMGFKLFVEFSTQRFSLLVNVTKGARYVRTGEAAFCYRLSRIASQKFSQELLFYLGTESGYFVFEPGVKDFCYNKTF